MTTVRQWLESIGYEPFPLMSESDRDQTGTVATFAWRILPLPDGWSGNVGTKDLREEVEVFDESGCKRGVFTPRELLWDCGPLLELRCRFVVEETPVVDGYFRFFVLDRETEERLKESRNLGTEHRDMSMWREELVKLRAFLYTNYPNWRDPLAYWTGE